MTRQHLPPERQRAYAEELAATRKMLDTVEVVGQVRREAEVDTLAELARRHPGEALRILREVEDP